MNSMIAFYHTWKNPKEAAVKKVCDSLLEHFFKKVDQDQFVSASSQNLQIKNIFFKEDCFLNHQVPLYVKHGLIETLTISISFSRLDIKIDKLILIGNEFFGSLIPQNDFSNSKKSIEKTFLQSIIETLLNILFYFFLSQTKNIFDLLTISIQNIHVRIERLKKDYPIYGIICKSIDISSIDQENEDIMTKNHPNDSLKRVVAKNFCVYLNDHEGPIDNISDNDLDLDSFKSFMLDKTNDYRFIINPFSFACICTFNTKLNTISKIQMRLNEFNFFIDYSQYNTLKKLKNQKKYSYLERPFEPDLSEESLKNWWSYVHRCAIFKKNPNYYLNVRISIDFLKKRQIYSDMLSECDDKKEYIDFMNTTDPNTLLLLNYYSLLRLNQSKKDDFADLKNNNPIKFEIAVENSLKFGLKDNSDTELFVVDIQGFECEGEKKVNFFWSNEKVEHSISFKANSICIYNPMNLEFTNLLINEINGSIMISNVDPITISLNISSLSFVLDVKFFSILAKFFGDTSGFFENHSEKSIQSIIDSRTKIDLDVNIEKSSFLIPYQDIIDEPPTLEVTFDSLKIKSNPISKHDSLFDLYKLLIDSLQMFFNNKEITNKINIDSNIKYSIIQNDYEEPIQIDSKISNVEASLTINQAIILKHIFLYISDKLTEPAIIKMIKSLPIKFNVFRALFNIWSFSMSIFYEKRQLFSFSLKDTTSIDISNKKDTLKLSVLNNTGIEGLEYFSSDNHEFLNTKKFELKYQANSQVDLIVDKIELFAKAVPLNFISVFAEFPIDYEWMLLYNEESSIYKYLYYNRKSEKKFDIKVNLELNDIKVHMVDDIECKNDSKIKNNDKIFLSVETEQIKMEKNQNSNAIKITFNPPQATTTQLGKKWTSIISKEENPQDPIIIILTPTSVSFDIEYFKANLSSIILSKLVKFALIVKNPYSHMFGDPETVKFLKYNIKLDKIILRIIYCNQFDDYYYDLIVSQFWFNTITPPTVHELQMDDIQIVHKNDIFFEIPNFSLILQMMFLLRHNVNQNDATNFNELLEVKGLKKWIDNTIEFFEYEEDENALSQAYFYFYALKLIFKFDELKSVYSRQFASDIMHIIDYLFDFLKNDSFYDPDNQKIQTIDHPLDISVDFQMKKCTLSLVDQWFNSPMANININLVNLSIDPKKNIYNININEVIVNDDQDDEIIKIASFITETIDDDIYAIVKSFNVFLKLKNITDYIFYFNHCPFLKLVDDYQNDRLKKINFNLKNNIAFALESFNLSVPVLDSLFSLNLAANAYITPEGKIAQIEKIHMNLDEKLIMKHFTILFTNDTWDVDPIFISFSVFDYNIIYSLLHELHSITKPSFHEFKPKEEIKKRKYFVNFDKIVITVMQLELPFVSLELEPSKLARKYSESDDNKKIIEYNVKMFLKYEDYLNLKKDKIIDPFEISLRSETTNHKTKIDGKITPIKMFLSSSFISEILLLKKKFYRFNKNDIQGFVEKSIKFQNDTSISINIHLIQQDSNHSVDHLRLDDNSEIDITDYDLKSQIQVDYLNYTITFSIFDLSIPMIDEHKKVAIYMSNNDGIHTIHFSSLYIVNNQLDYDINVCINDSPSIITVRKHCQNPIPVLNTDHNSMQMKAFVHQEYQQKSKSFEISLKQCKKPIFYKFINSCSKKNFYSYVYAEIEPQKLVCIITFLPFVIYENQLPIPITLSIKNIDNNFINYCLATGESCDISFLYDKFSKLQIKINAGPFGKSDILKDPLYEESSNPKKVTIKQPNGGKYNISIIHQCDKKTKAYKNIIFTPFIVYNNTSQNLILNSSKSEFYQFIEGKCIYSPNEFFSSGKVSLRIKLKDCQKISEKQIDCINDNNNHIFSLPYNEDESISSYISSVKKGTRFVKTNQLILHSYFTVCNHLNSTIFLNPSNLNTIKNCCQPNESTPIKYSNADCKFTFKIEDYFDCYEINLKSQSTTIFRLISKDEKDYLIVRLDVINENEGFYGHFSYQTFPYPIVITNTIDNHIILVEENQQKNTLKTYPMIVNSWATSIYAKTQPFIDQNSQYENCVNMTIIDELHISDDISFTVDYSFNTEPKKIQNTNYIYEVKETQKGNKMILVTHKKTYETLNNLIKFEFSQINIDLAKLEISFADKMNELCLLELENIEYILRKQESIEFSIDSIFFNDMHGASKSPAVLCKKGPTKFLMVKIESQLPVKRHIFESIDIEISPLQIFFDVIFVCDLYSAISNIISESNFSLVDQNEEKFEYNYRPTSMISLKEIIISQLHFDIIKINFSSRQNRLPLPQMNMKCSIYYHILTFLPELPFHKIFRKFNDRNVHAPIFNYIKSLYPFYENQIQKRDFVPCIFNDSVYNYSSGSFDDLINDENISNNKSVIVSPSRLPITFPLYPFINSTINDNDIAGKYSLAQFTFQKIHREENILLLVFSNNMKNKERLALFDHYVVLFSEDLHIVIKRINLKELKTIDTNENFVAIKGPKKKNIIFKCENKENAFLINTKVQLIFRRIQIFGF